MCERVFCAVLTEMRDVPRRILFQTVNKLVIYFGTTENKGGARGKKRQLTIYCNFGQFNSTQCTDINVPTLYSDI